jgi:hypothetical protein
MENANFQSRPISVMRFKIKFVFALTISFFALLTRLHLKKKELFEHFDVITGKQQKIGENVHKKANDKNS